MTESSQPLPTKIAPAADPVAPGAALPMVSEPAVPFIEIEALRAQQFIPAAKEALGSLLAEQAQGKLIRPVFNWAGRNSLFPRCW